MTSKHADPLSRYRDLRRGGTLQGDPQQDLAMEKLQALHNRLQHYRPSGEASGWTQLLQFGRRSEPPPQGLYIYGDVGRGKSMLMDLFFDATAIPHKRRVHFHAFMLEVHAMIHRWRQLDPKGKERKEGGDDPIPPVAKQIAKQAWLLCFDEFQVTDVADAMILRRLFEKLFKRGVVVVATSNRAPGDLYLNGLNRPLFLPFIDLLKERLDVLHLAGVVDYRLNRLAGQSVWHASPGPEANAALDAAFATLTDDALGVPMILEMQGRKLTVPVQARGVARMRFAELCETALGAADYLALAARFHTLILADIPVLTPEQRNAAKRFTTLIDTLYEAKVKLIASAGAAPDILYPDGDESFEFRRCVSRLEEMQSDSYRMLAHQPPEMPV